MTNNKWYTEAIDRAVSEREFARLTDMIRSPDLSSWAIVAKLEEQEYDSMVDDAMEAEWAEAVKHLREEHGDREFSDEEVDAEIEEMHRSWEDAHPDG